ncbi:MAG: 2-C-methyl-D-erythritol 2,4-cyclodiphosphate synthase, partial [Clostridia bacterium]|nr:2-C-methyl-D-erythritol 2,4-cyclodiphosphate synthase [Clostridia bacterium]
PYRQEMRKKIAETMGVDVSCISVKATTTEKMGFEGEGLGISSHAVACVLRKR